MTTTAGGEPLSSGRRPRTTLSAMLTLAIMSSAVIGFRDASPLVSAPTGYRAYVSRSGEPALFVDTGAKVPPMTFSVATAGLHGTIAALPQETGQLLFAVAGGEDADPDLQVERSYSSQVDADGSVFATTVLTLLKADGYATGVIAGSRGIPLMYTPPRLELPAEIAIGTTWTSEGAVNVTGRYSFSGAIEAADSRDRRRCMRTNTILEQGSPYGRPYTRTTRATWCEGLGAVEEATDESGTHFALAEPGSIRLEPVPPPEPEAIPAGRTLPSLFPFSYLSLRPVTMGGLVISTNGSSGDLRAVHPTADGQRLSWMQHPGGEVLGMAADDSLLYVTTTERRLMAFDAAGCVHWIRRLPDAAAGDPTESGDIVTVALLDGTMRAFDCSTGEQRWSIRLDDTIVVPSVVTAGHIVSADTSGLITATNPDGKAAWSESIGAVRSPMTELSGDVVLVQDSEGILHAFDSTGDKLWTADLGEKVVGKGTAIGDTVILPVRSGVIGISAADGSSAWHLETPAPPAITAGATLTAGSLTGRINADGTLVDRRELTSADPESLRHTWPITLGTQHLVVDASGAITAIGNA